MGFQEFCVFVFRKSIPNWKAFVLFELSFSMSSRCVLFARSLFEGLPPVFYSSFEGVLSRQSGVEKTSLLQQVCRKLDTFVKHKNMTC